MHEKHAILVLVSAVFSNGRSRRARHLRRHTTLGGSWSAAERQSSVVRGRLFVVFVPLALPCRNNNNNNNNTRLSRSALCNQSNKIHLSGVSEWSIASPGGRLRVVATELIGGRPSEERAGCPHLSSSRVRFLSQPIGPFHSIYVSKFCAAEQVAKRLPVSWRPARWLVWCGKREQWLRGEWESAVRVRLGAERLLTDASSLVSSSRPDRRR